MTIEDGRGRAPPREIKAHTETLKPRPRELKSFKLNGAFYMQSRKSNTCKLKIKQN